MTLLDAFRSVYAMPWRGVVALVLTIVTAVFALWLFPAASRATGSPKNKVTDLQRAYTAEMFGSALRKWSKADENAVGIMKSRNIRRLDFIFPALYGLALAFAYAAISGRRAPTALDFVLFVTPLVAALFDYVENTTHLRLLRGIETGADVERAISEGRFSDSVVFLGSAFAHAKYVLLAVSVVGLLIAVVGRVRQAMA
jgi:hypothetical protein